MELEQQLRRALRRVDPPDDFYDRLATRIENPSGEETLRSRRHWRMELRAVAASLAGGLLLATLLLAGLRYRAFLDEQRAEGERARAEVMLALRITSQKTRLARQAVQNVDEPNTAVQRN